LKTRQATPRKRALYHFPGFQRPTHQSTNRQAVPTTTPISFITLFFPFPFLSNHASL
jgi:hypothetical protein